MRNEFEFRTAFKSDNPEVAAEQLNIFAMHVTGLMAVILADYAEKRDQLTHEIWLEAFTEAVSITGLEFSYWVTVVETQEGGAAFAVLASEYTREQAKEVFEKVIHHAYAQYVATVEAPKDPKQLN